MLCDGYNLFGMDSGLGLVEESEFGLLRLHVSGYIHFHVAVR